MCKGKRNSKASELRLKHVAQYKTFSFFCNTWTLIHILVNFHWVSCQQLHKLNNDHLVGGWGFRFKALAVTDTSPKWETENIFTSSHNELQRLKHIFAFPTTGLKIAIVNSQQNTKLQLSRWLQSDAVLKRFRVKIYTTINTFPTVWQLVVLRPPVGEFWLCHFAWLQAMVFQSHTPIYLRYKWHFSFLEAHF